MATAPERPSARQLWLDVDRPIAVKPRRDRTSGSVVRPAAQPVAQMEFRMVSGAARPVLYPPIERAPPARPFPAVAPLVNATTPASFGAWLLEQIKRSGTLGELAKAVRLDRRFPKTGSAEAVRRHFGSIGADGDAFEALDDAEREYDRL